MLDIGYDIWVKEITFHLLLFDLLILAPDIRRLFGILILRKTGSLSAVPVLIENKKLRWPGYILKVCVMGIAIIPLLKGELKYFDQLRHSPYAGLTGIHKVGGFSLRHLPGNRSNKDTLSWKQFAVNQADWFNIQFSNDSIYTCWDMTVDTLHKLLTLKDYDDTTLNSRLHYAQVAGGEWRFKGVFKNDSVSFTTTRTDISKLQVKGYGKIKWSW
jgi:hypothetical protein